MKRVLSLILVLSLALAVGQFLPTAATSTEFVDVIIGFHGAPQAGIVTAVGGEVSHSFTLINAVSATIPANAVRALANNPTVAYVEPNAEVHTLQTVPWGISHIGATTVHATGNKGANVRVAIIDTGIQTNHPDLATYGGYNFVGNNSNYNDDNGHGTHVAGTVAALDNSVGVIGVAPAARLYGVKVLSATGSGTLDDVIAGIEWSVNNNMHIINMSLGTTSHSAALENACNAAYNAGVLVVAAAGNSGNRGGRGNNVNYPARYASVIAVAAVDQNNNRAWWSSTGPTVEIAAPGVSILSTYTGGGYATASGTSMACPHVAGVGALVQSKYSSWTNVQIRNRMNSSAMYLGNPDHFGYGLVQAVGATQ